MQFFLALSEPILKYLSSRRQKYHMLNAKLTNMFFLQVRNKFIAASFDALYNRHDYITEFSYISFQCLATGALSKELLLWNTEYDKVFLSCEKIIDARPRSCIKNFTRRTKTRTQCSAEALLKVPEAEHWVKALVVVRINGWKAYVKITCSTAAGEEVPFRGDHRSWRSKRGVGEWRTFQAAQARKFPYSLQQDAKRACQCCRYVYNFIRTYLI